MAVQKNTDGWRPIPDPTVLTTELTLREVANLKELLQSQTTNLENQIAYLRTQVDHRRAEIIEIRDDAVERLQSLFAERFDKIENQFVERDVRQDVLASTSKDSINAALTAQKEAMTKTESAFTKQIDQMQLLINAVAKATDGKIDDLKTRLTLIEGKAKGIGEGWGIIVAAGGLATGILIAVASYVR